MDLRPPILVVADAVTVDPATRRVTISGVRHFIEASSYPSTRVFGVYFFAGSGAADKAVEIRLGPAMTEESTLIWSGRMRHPEVALAVTLPAIEIPRPGFLDFQARLDGRRVAWTRMEARSG